MTIESVYRNPVLGRKKVTLNYQTRRKLREIRAWALLLFMLALLVVFLHSSVLAFICGMNERWDEGAYRGITAFFSFWFLNYVIERTDP